MSGAIDRDGLFEHFAAGLTRDGERLIGLEYEMLGLDRRTGGALSFFGGERSVEGILGRLATRFGWNEIRGAGKGNHLLELERGGSRVTLEPGAQLELSARPHRSLAEVRRELSQFKKEVRDVSSDLDIAWLPLGLQPLTVPEDVRIIPKRRYDVMTRYLPTRGDHALWMMRTSAGMQINLDVFSPAEAARKLRLALRASPLITAIFANSPLSAGEVNGFATRRGYIWRDVDPDRCGVPERLIAADATIANYFDWALDAGMFFVARGDDLVDMTGVTFRRFVDDGARGLEATIDDWNLHLTTLFPEARLKSYLEVRCADSNSTDLALAYVALSLGLLYGGEETLAELEALVGGLSPAELDGLHETGTRRGLADRAVRGLAAQLVAIAAASLEAHLPDDRPFLAPAEEMVESGRTPADALLDAHRDAGSIAELVETLHRRELAG